MFTMAAEERRLKRDLVEEAIAAVDQGYAVMYGDRGRSVVDDLVRHEDREDARVALRRYLRRLDDLRLEVTDAS